MNSNICHVEKGFDIENLKRSLDVLKSYIILGGYDFMKVGLISIFS